MDVLAKITSAILGVMGMCKDYVVLVHFPVEIINALVSSVFQLKFWSLSYNYNL